MHSKNWHMCSRAERWHLTFPGAPTCNRGLGQGIFWEKKKDHNMLWFRRKKYTRYRGNKSSARYDQWRAAPAIALYKNTECCINIQHSGKKNNKMVFSKNEIKKFGRSVLRKFDRSAKRIGIELLLPVLDLLSTVGAEGAGRAVGLTSAEANQ